MAQAKSGHQEARRGDGATEGNLPKNPALDPSADHDHAAMVRNAAVRGGNTEDGPQGRSGQASRRRWARDEADHSVNEGVTGKIDWSPQCCQPRRNVYRVRHLMVTRATGQFRPDASFEASSSTIRPSKR